MAIYNLGSINIDHVYRMRHLPAPGETIAALDYAVGLGGKGANQTIAAAQAGAKVHHIGAIGANSDWTLELLIDSQADVKHISKLDIATGHAIIYVDAVAENTIVLFEGANHALTESQIDAALSSAQPDDWLLLQNETNLGLYAVKRAQSLKMKIAYSAAPFSAHAVREILPFTDLVVVNEVEAQQIEDELPEIQERLAKISMLVTHGSRGSTYRIGQTFKQGNANVSVPAFFTQAIDTAGAGDTYLGYLLAGLDSKLSVKKSMIRASAASSLQVARKGAAIAIPKLNEVEQFLSEQA